MRCGDCLHWRSGVDLEGNLIKDEDFQQDFHLGACTSEKMVYVGQSNHMPYDGLGYYDFEGCAAGIITGENFGCIHFKPKQE